MALDLDDPIAVLIAAVGALEHAKLDALVYGGLALAVYGEPRETRDADLAVSGVTAAAAEGALGAIGMTVVRAFEDAPFGGVSISRLTLVGGGKLNTVDLVTPRSPRYAAVVMGRPLRGTLDGHELAIIAPEDFVLLKVLSTRDRDLEDARSVVGALGDRLDREQVRTEAVALAAELPDHEVLARLRLALS